MVDPDKDTTVADDGIPETSVGFVTITPYPPGGIGAVEGMIS